MSALKWRDVSDARDGDGVLLTVRTSKTNQEGDAADVRYLKNGAANAIRILHAADADAAPTDRAIGLSPLQIQRRFTAAARAAGIEARVTAHSGRVGLASELTARGASTTEVMLAGNWKNRPHGRALLGGRDRRTRGPSESICKGGDGTTAKPRHSRINATGSPRSHHGLRLTVGELLEAFYRGGGKVRRSGERPGDWELIRRACRWISGAAAGVADPQRDYRSTA